MKTIIAFIAFGLLAALQSGCTSGVSTSVGHDGHRHGVSARGGTGNGVSGALRAY